MFTTLSGMGLLVINSWSLKRGPLLRQGLMNESRDRDDTKPYSSTTKRTERL